MSALTDIINTAAVAFGDLDQAKQPVYAKAFGEFIHQLDPTLSANQSTLLEAFENSIASALTARYCVTASCLRYDYTGPLVELTHAAALDQSYVGAFEQVCCC